MHTAHGTILFLRTNGILFDLSVDDPYHDPGAILNTNDIGHVDSGQQSVDDPRLMQGLGNATILDEDDAILAAALAQIDDVTPENLEQPIETLPATQPAQPVTREEVLISHQSIEEVRSPTSLCSQNAPAASTVQCIISSPETDRDPDACPSPMTLKRSSNTNPRL